MLRLPAGVGLECGRRGAGRSANHALLLTAGFLFSAHFGGFAQNAQTDRGVIADLISKALSDCATGTLFCDGCDRMGKVRTFEAEGMRNAFAQMELCRRRASNVPQSNTLATGSTLFHPNAIRHRRTAAPDQKTAKPSPISNQSGRISRALCIACLPTPQFQV